MRQPITRPADAVIVDDPNGAWFAVWNSTEGFDPLTAAIRAESASDAEEVWEENFPDRGTGESLVVLPVDAVHVVVALDWPDSSDD